MSVVLRVDRARWFAHLEAMRASVPGLVGVVKGNGYGYGLSLLAQTAQELGLPVLAVGTATEVAAVREHFSGDIVVLQPWRPGNLAAEELLADDRVIHTVSRVVDLADLASRGRPRVLIEVLTSMRRHGIEPERLGEVVPQLERLNVEGWTLHLPLAGDNAREAKALVRTALAVREAPLWLSHLPAAQASRLGREFGVDTRLRLGTSLWLGSPSSRQTTAVVLDVHPVRRGERVGYWQRPVPGNGHVVVLSGGTAQGVALAAPNPARNLRQRLIALAEGFWQAAGRSRSPYSIGGAKRWFVEPPHMQASLVFLPADVTAPQVGDEVPVELRLTTAHVDRVEFR